MKRKPRICIDFDGVIHGYSRGYQDGSLYDLPMEGAKETIDYLRDTYEITIFTARIVPDDDRFVSVTSKEDIEYYLRLHDIYFDEITGHKLPAVAYIDDRAIEFKSWWDIMPKIEEMERRTKEEFSVKDFSEIFDKFGDKRG